MNLPRICLFSLAFVLPWNAHALESEWSIKTLLLYQTVDEIAQSGTTLVSESGVEPALELGGSWPQTAGGALFGKVLLSGSTLDYEGRTQSGRPVDSETDYRRLRMTLGYSHAVTPATKLKAQFETEWLSRDINGIGSIAGLNEETQSSRLLLGLEKELGGSGRPISVEVAGVFGLSGTQEVSSPGIVDEVALPEGQAIGARFAAVIPLGVPRSSGWAWALTPVVEYLQTDRSEDRLWSQNGVIRGTLAQPEMRRWSAGVGLMATW